jgi:hypothetical protein
MIKFLVNILTIAILLLASGCAAGSAADYGPGTYTIRGKMHFTDIEGGCWQLITGNNQSYELVGEDTPFLEYEGLMAEIVVKDTDNIMSTCMVGKVVQIIKIITYSK